MTGESKVVSTEQLLRAMRLARLHNLTLVLDQRTEERLDSLGQHVLGRLPSDTGDRQHNGLPYYRVTAMLALEEKLESVQRVIDVPAVLWKSWTDADVVIARLKDLIAHVGEMPTEVRVEDVA